MTDAVLELASQITVLCGLVGVVLGLLGLLARRKGAWLWHGGAAAFAAVLAAGGWLAAWAGLPASVWGSVVALAAALVGFQALQCRAGVWLLAAVADLLRRPWAPAASFLTVCPLVAFWCAAHLTPPPMSLPEEMGIDPERLIEVTDAYAVTDRGRHVPLYTLPAEDEATREGKHTDVTLVRDRLARLIRTGDPDLTHNCHGWVFAGGQGWVKGRDVDPILEDNGYQKVAAPRPGDVVVYRAAAGGSVLHTGVVRTAESGLVLVESKWGALGRYLHTVEDQCYGSNFAYHRTERPNHIVQGLGPASPGSTLPAGLPRRVRRAG